MLLETLMTYVRVAISKPIKEKTQAVFAKGYALLIASF